MVVIQCRGDILTIIVSVQTSNGVFWTINHASDYVVTLGVFFCLSYKEKKKKNLILFASIIKSKQKKKKFEMVVVAVFMKSVKLMYFTIDARRPSSHWAGVGTIIAVLSLWPFYSCFFTILCDFWWLFWPKIDAQDWTN